DHYIAATEESSLNYLKLYDIILCWMSFLRVQTEFLSMSTNVEEKSETGSELFPGELLSPKDDQQNLPNELLALLTQYYNI
ncbi:7726_t:CDS:2, partial [Gigaspora rosea]